MRTRLLGALMAALALILLTPAAVAAEPYDIQSAQALEANGWTEREWYDHTGPFRGEMKSRWCKTWTNVDDNDLDSFPEGKFDGLSEIADYYLEILERASPEGRTGQEAFDEEINETSDLLLLCVNPEQVDRMFTCVGIDRDTPRIYSPENRPGDSGPDFSLQQSMVDSCYDINGDSHAGWSQPYKELAAEVLEDPTNVDLVGRAVTGIAVSAVTELSQGLRGALASILYWWIMIPHADVETSPSTVIVWPYMLGFGLMIGIGLMAWQGVKMLFTQKAGVLIATLKGLASFFFWVIIGIGAIAALGHAAESMASGIMNMATNESGIGCTRYQTGQPDGLVLDLPEGGDANEVARQFASCASAQMFVQTGTSVFVLLLYVVAFVLSLLQAFLLFLREAALPVLALLLPIAAAGQIGGSATKRWLPNLVNMVLVMLAYKPMIALIFAVGFTNSSLSDSVLDILRGMLTLLIGVVAPGIMLKAFKPVATQIVEDAGSMGSTVNNVFMASQMGSSVNHWMERRAGTQAAKQARTEAAQHAARQGGGSVAMAATKKAGGTAAKVGAEAAGGPVGWVAAVGDVVKGAGKAVAAGAKGPEAELKGAHPHGKGPAGPREQGTVPNSQQGGHNGPPLRQDGGAGAGTPQPTPPPGAGAPPPQLEMREHNPAPPPAPPLGPPPGPPPEPAPPAPAPAPGPPPASPADSATPPHHVPRTSPPPTPRSAPPTPPLPSTDQEKDR